MKILQMDLDDLGRLGSPISSPHLSHPLSEENLLDRSQLQALVEYQKSAAPGMLAEGQAEMLIGADRPEFVGSCYGIQIQVSKV